MNNYCYVIAEAGLNHNGDFELATKLIDVASEAGSDAVKFQKRTVSKLAINSVLDAEDSRFPEFGKTYREIREKHEFNAEQYAALKDYSEKKGMDFIVTAFDIDAVDFLLELGVDKFKLASHSLTNIGLLKYLAEKKVDTILSTGMSSLDEIDTAVKIFKENRAPLKLMHCISAYPTPPEQCNMKMMVKLKEKYNLPTGYSGHEIGYLPTLVAVSMGAELIERHYTLDKKMVGFDHKMSLEPDELKNMVSDIREIMKIKGTGDKTISETEWVTRKKYHVSIASKDVIKKGSALLESMVTYRNPGTGIPAKDLVRILNKTAKEEIRADVLLSLDMFE
jgi:sialic acid synthase SpsE